MRFLSKVVAVLSLTASMCIQAQSPPPLILEPPKLRIPRVSRAPKLEDFLAGTPREAEARVSDFRQSAPGDGTPVSQQTTAYLSYDDRNLYVIFMCKDDPEKIRARLSRREEIDSDDNVGIDLDTFHDHQRYYMFLVNPRGVQMDAIVTEGQGTDVSFDTLWYSDTRLTPDGFVAWMAIPFNSLRFPNTPSQNWGVALGRMIKRNSELSFWPYITERLESSVQQFAELDGLENISPGRNLQFIPYFVSSRSRFLDPLSPGRSEFRTDTEARPGLDGKLVLRDALTFDFALNPDFSQVESDEPQVTVNQRFEVFFPEKRPFFIENAGYFQTPVNLFFSRRIADPQFGARMTGKLGRWGLGVLTMDDRAEGKQLPYDDPLRGRRAAVGVVRVQREFVNQSTVGVLITSRDFASSFNRVFSLDTRLKLNPNWIFSGQAVRSDARQLDSTRSSGSAYWAELSQTGRHTLYAARYADYSPNFESKLGFIPRVDVRKMEHYFRYYWKSDTGRVLQFGPDITTSLNWNRQGQLQDWIVDVNFGAGLRGPTAMGCRHVNAYELFSRIGFRHHYTDCGVDTKRLQWLELNADYGWGTAVNYFPAPGLSPFVANGNSVKFTATARLTRNISFVQTYMYTRLATRAPIAGFDAGTSIFNDHVFRSKLNVQFTRALSLRAIVDYHAVLPNQLLVSVAAACASCGGYLSTKRLTGDVLLTYLLHPGTGVYVGYTERRENPLDPSRPPQMQPSGSPTIETGRMVFVKVSYLFRY